MRNNFNYDRNNQKKIENFFNKKTGTKNNNINNSNYNYIKNKYNCFLLENHPEELILPVYIRVKIYLLYGSYCLKKFQTQPYLIKDFIELNDTALWQ